MSSPEFIGLLVTVSLLGILVGAVLTWMAALRRNRLMESRVRRNDAYAHWLSAWMTLSRASASFVAAFRALAAERRDAEYFALRREEAQRTRGAWWDAMRELDHAEAMLLMWSDDPDVAGRLAALERVAPDALRVAINGVQTDIDKLMQRLRETDLKAGELVRTAAAQTGKRREFICWFFAPYTNFLAKITDRWSKL